MLYSHLFAGLCSVMLSYVSVSGETEAILSGSTSNQLPNVCQKKCKKDMISTETEKYCKEHSGLSIHERCCVNSSSSIVKGIDLQECNLTRDAFSLGIKNLSQLAVISLQGNPITELKETDFNENSDIDYLSLPPKMHCPGGDDIWQNTSFSASVTLCLDELNACHVHNVSCPHNSHCLPHGLNMTICLCDEGYHGYKCMKKGHFPFIYYGIGISVPTAVLCLILWISQRRYVKSKPKNT